MLQAIRTERPRARRGSRWRPSLSGLGLLLLCAVAVTAAFAVTAVAMLVGAAVLAAGTTAAALRRRAGGRAPVAVSPRPGRGRTFEGQYHVERESR